MYTLCRSTKEFSVSVSSELAYWTEVVSGVLYDVRSKSCDDASHGKVVYLFPAQKVKYAKFVAKSYYGHGPALQFFDISGPPQECSS